MGCGFARSKYPRYTGQRPEMQVCEGTADTLVKHKNLVDQLAPWSNVLGLAFTYNSTKNSEISYTKIFYEDGSKLVGYSAQVIGDFFPFQEVQMLDFFGLMSVTTTTTVAITTASVTSVTSCAATTPSAPTGISATQTKYGLYGGSLCTGPALLSASLGQHAQHRIPTTPSVCEVIEQISRVAYAFSNYLVYLYR